MEVVDQQQVRDELVLGRVGAREQPRERLAVERDDGLDGGRRAGVLLDLLEQALDPSDPLADRGVLH
jgi:hypothetical protein